jgi:hypothetical protein
MISACGSFDFKLIVRNDTGQSILIRVPAGIDDQKYVTRVDPGVQGMAVAWTGNRDAIVELLEDDCSVSGTFESDDGEHFSVSGVSGVTATLSPYEWLRDGWNEPGLVPTEACGGFVGY